MQEELKKTRGREKNEKINLCFGSGGLSPVRRFVLSLCGRASQPSGGDGDSRQSAEESTPRKRRIIPVVNNFFRFIISVPTSEDLFLYNSDEIIIPLQFLKAFGTEMYPFFRESK